MSKYFTITRLEASGYHDKVIKLLIELGFTEHFQFNTQEEASAYVESLEGLIAKVVVIHFADDHYGVWADF